MESLHKTLAGWQQGLLPAVERFWLENPSPVQPKAKRKPSPGKAQPDQALIKRLGQTVMLKGKLFKFVSIDLPFDRCVLNCDQNSTTISTRISTDELKNLFADQEKTVVRPRIGRGRVCTTPNGYQVKVKKTDPTDASRVLVVYVGKYQHLGVDSYPIALLTPVEPAEGPKAKKPSVKPEKLVFEVPQPCLESAAKLNSSEALTRDKIKGIFQHSERSWVVTGSSHLDKTLQVNLIQIVERSQWAGSLHGYSTMERWTQHRGQLIKFRGKEWVLTGREATLFPESCDLKTYTPEQLFDSVEVEEKDKSRFSQKGQACGWIETRLGNTQRDVPSTSIYFCYYEITGQQQTKRSIYLQKHMAQDVRELVDLRSPLAKTLQIIRDRSRKQSRKEWAL